MLTSVQRLWNRRYYFKHFNLSETHLPACRFSVAKYLLSKCTCVGHIFVKISMGKLPYMHYLIILFMVHVRLKLHTA